MVQVLPMLLIAVGVIAWQDISEGRWVYHASARQKRRFQAQAWWLYLVLPFVAESGLIVALFLPTVGLDDGPLVTWMAPISLAVSLFLTLGLFGSTANYFVRQSQQLRARRPPRRRRRAPNPLRRRSRLRAW